MPQSAKILTKRSQASAHSRALFARAKAIFPGGTTRATIDRDPFPRYITHGEGAYVYDVDGNSFLDLNNNFTTLIHGHGFAPVIEKVERVLRDGTCFANPTEHEINLAELLCSRIPAVEKVRFVNTGTEAVMFAIKAARAFTGKPGLARIEGAYHGAYDWAEAGQNGTPDTWGDPDSPVAVPSYRGMPNTVADDIVVIRLNDPEHARTRLIENADRLSCILIDPMPSRAGLIALEPEFIKIITDTAHELGILILSDEVLNLRQGFEGASARYGIEPDLVTMGKIIGGGFPVGAIGGNAEVMEMFGTDSGKAALAQGGTFSANPVSMIAGLACMKAMTNDQFSRLEEMGNRLRADITKSIAEYGVPFCVSGAASLFRIHTKPTPPREFREAHASTDEMRVLKNMQWHFMACGISLPVGAAACLSTAMTDQDIDKISAAWSDFLAAHTTSN